MTIDANAEGGPAEPVERCYWNPFARSRQVAAEPDEAYDGPERTEELEGLLTDAVRCRMEADVPLGALLSGGIDSASIVALMQESTGRRIKTFTIGFRQPSYDEADHARAVAEHLGTEHHELYVEANDALRVVPRIATMYDEPFADSSQIPTSIVSELARGEVTVALSGDGGDELFGGYNRYLWAKKIWRSIGWTPKPVRQALAWSLTALTPESWDQLLELGRPLLPEALGMVHAGDKAHKLAAILRNGDQDDIYERLVTFWHRPEEILALRSGNGIPPLADPVRVLQRHLQQIGISDFLTRMMLVDLGTYLPEDILVKVDRASMAASLEVRSPLLDYRLVELSSALPPQAKIRNGHRQVAAPQDGVPASAPVAARAPQGRLLRTARRVAAGPAPRLGVRAPGSRHAGPRRDLSSRGGSSVLDGAPERASQLGSLPLGSSGLPVLEARVGRALRADVLGQRRSDTKSGVQVRPLADICVHQYIVFIYKTL